MLVYRISHKRYTEHLNGEGAFRVGGRWNNKGVRVVYTSSSIALASLEVLVHTEGLPIPEGMLLLTFDVSDELLEEIEKLPSDWNRIPPINATKKIGDDFILANKDLGLIVPSAIIPEERNVLLNPLNEHMNSVKLVNQRDFAFDSRL